MVSYQENNRNSLSTKLPLEIGETAHGTSSKNNAPAEVPVEVRSLVHRAMRIEPPTDVLSVGSAESLGISNGIAGNGSANNSLKDNIL